MYKIRQRIRYSETDSTGKLSMQGLLRIFQDCSYMHAEDRGRGVGFQAETHCAWFLLSWCIRLFEPPTLSEYVTVETYFYYMHGSIARKWMSMKNDEGKEIAHADTIWGYVDTERDVPVDCPPNLWSSEDFAELPENAKSESRKIKVSDKSENTVTEKLPEFAIYPYLIDTNRHANNVRFTELAMRLADCEVGCRSLRAEFLRQAFLDSTVFPCVYQSNDKKIVSMNNSKGRPFAVFEFTKTPD